ncbi:MAG: response regulator [Firmicutes bacterium]|nr:response regulator [Bacillota bacterium]
MNILIVDDSNFMRMQLRRMVEAEGHVVVGESENGAKAVTDYHNCNPDLVLMDITMDTMDGIEATSEIKKINSQAKIIVCSAMGQEAMVRKAIAAGACDFIVKPVTKDRFIKSINNIAC